MVVLVTRALSPPVMQLEHKAVKFTCCSCKQEKAHSSCWLAALDVVHISVYAPQPHDTHDTHEATHATHAEEIRTERCTR